MFIDPLTLFIVGEIFVVYVIINIFLFYKSRLYQVLLALLKEMRFEKLRREQEKQKELAELRATNKGLLQKTENLEASVKTAGKTIGEQLGERILELVNKYPKAKDLTNSVEREESAQWLRMRMLELEKELLSGAINEKRWEELATEAISRLNQEVNNEKQRVTERKDGAEDDRYIGQLETDLEEAQRQFADAKIRIRQLEGEVESLKTINTPAPSHLETPTRGLYEDEIYRLKCDNFDMHEAINKLKLELQQTDPSIDSDTYVALLENQLANMDQYIKSADITAGLMEKELSAAAQQIESLQAKMANQGSGTSSETLSTLHSLADQQQAKTDTLGSIKETIIRLKNGEDPEQLAAEQEAHIARLEQIIKESEQCIAILESELSQSSQDIHELKGELAKKKTELITSKLSGLADVQQGQGESVGTMKSLIDDIRRGGDTEESLKKQELEISKLERFLSESDMIIGQLESEIEELNQKLSSASTESPESYVEERPDSDEDLLEMESLLQQFISDIQGLMKMINQLEDENIELKTNFEKIEQKLKQTQQNFQRAKKTDFEGSNDLFEPTGLDQEPPIMIEVEPNEQDS